MKNYLLLLAAAASFTFTSCGGDDDDTTTPPAPAPTRTEMITNKNWKLTAETETRTDTTGTIDHYAQMDACNQDDILRYSADNKFTVNEGATKCDPSDPQEIAAGTWAFTNNETKLLLTIFGFAGETDIVELTPTKLVTRSTDTDQGVTSVTTSTFMAQ